MQSIRHIQRTSNPLKAESLGQQKDRRVGLRHDISEFPRNVVGAGVSVDLIDACKDVFFQ